jgi:SAV_6107-like HEPN
MTTTTVRRLGPSLVPSQVLPSALGLLEQARRGLREADTLRSPAERYATAHLAALRGAAAVLAARTKPTDAHLRRRRPTSAWVLLTDVAPELAEWAAFFAAGAAKRAAAEAGVTKAVSAREADDLMRDVGTFLALVETTLGLVPTLPVGTPRAG